MSAKINNLRNLRKSDFKIIKELSLLGAYVVTKANGSLTDKQEEALDNLLNCCISMDLDTLHNENELSDEVIEKYDEIVFWLSLSKRLAARDTLLELGSDINIDNLEKYKSIRDEYEEIYLKKFKIEQYRDIAEDKIIVLNESLLPY